MKMEMEMKNILTEEELKRLLKEGEIFFFAGSGISYASNLPTAFDIVSRTLKRLLPGFESKNERKQFVVGNKAGERPMLQPELFYSILLEACHGNNRCLDMWKCIHRVSWEGKSYDAAPNLVHYFIAAYSYINRLPIFTVNYDDMFEEACKKMKICYEVLSSEEDLEKTLDMSKLMICKLHGDINKMSLEDGLNIAHFRTTMDGITKLSISWLSYLNNWICDKQKTICFVGYSGQDVDYYPQLKRIISAKKLKAVWFTKEKLISNDIGRINADKINAIIYPDYPSEVFPKICSSVFSCVRFSKHMAKISKIDDSDKDTKQRVLEAYLNGFMETCPSGASLGIDEEITWLLLMLRTDHFVEAWHTIVQLEEHDLDPIWISFVKDARMMLERSFAKFSSYGRHARRNLWRCRIEKIWRYARREKGERIKICIKSEWNAHVQLISSWQMKIPTRLSFEVPWTLQRYDLVLLVKFLFYRMNRFFQHGSSRFRTSETLYGKLLYSALQESDILIEECKLRALAIDVSLAKINLDKYKINKTLLRYLKHIQCEFKSNLINKLLDLKRKTERDGNYTTLIGAMGYLNELYSKNDILEIDILEMDDVQKSVGMTQQYSLIARMLRTVDPNEALKKAIQCGIVLDIIKALLAKKNKFGILCPKDEELLIRSMDQVDSASLQLAFSYIRRRYLQITHSRQFEPLNDYLKYIASLLSTAPFE